MATQSLQRLMWVLWPAFLVAGIAETAFFSLFDPLELAAFNAHHDASRESIYAIGFIAFWTFGIVSSALTVYLSRSPFEVNRCPLDAGDRPPGCPKRDMASSQCGGVACAPPQ